MCLFSQLPNGFWKSASLQVWKLEKEYEGRVAGVVAESVAAACQRYHLPGLDCINTSSVIGSEDGAFKTQQVACMFCLQDVEFLVLANPKLKAASQGYLFLVCSSSVQILEEILSAIIVIPPEHHLSEQTTPSGKEVQVVLVEIVVALLQPNSTSTSPSVSSIRPSIRPSPSPSSSFRHQISFQLSDARIDLNIPWMYDN